VPHACVHAKNVDVCYNPNPNLWDIKHSSFVLQACRCNPTIRRLCSELDITPAHVWRAVKRFNPKMCVRTPILKHELTPKNKAARVVDCAINLDKGKRFLLNTIFCDEATILLCPTATKVIGQRGKEVLRTDARLRPSVQMGRALKFLLAVDSHIGCVALEHLSTSSAYTGAIYKVGVGVDVTNVCLLYYISLYIR
jgi:hypothetical protein